MHTRTLQGMLHLTSLMVANVKFSDCAKTLLFYLYNYMYSIRDLIRRAVLAYK